ncbi:MAG: indolepyruvate oxidoreductase subunit beta [Treponema sp.]|jgi:indolepyruvate ferredoxin oxidoreductase beta subunit|nr:indolepyruvate oxidoreductase subunit beta [Treponema sp.]
MILNCLLTGVGGQGTVLLSRLIGGAALERGLEVRGSETIGMAQRGGSVVSHIRMGRNIASPLIPPGKADVIIAFEVAEAVRVLPFLAPGGRMLALNRVLRQHPAAGLSGAGYDPRLMLDYLQEKVGGGLAVVDNQELAARCGSPRVINVALLGAALARGFFPFDAADAQKVLAERIPPAYRELNLRALEIGRDEGQRERERPGASLSNFV